MTPNRYAAVGAAVLAATALAVAGGAAPAAASPGTAELSQSIVISDNHFTPDDVGVHVGDKVTWTNTDEVAHTVVAISGPEPFGTGREVLHTGDKYWWRFTEPGLYRYWDRLNHGMRGTVRVGARQRTDVPPPDDWGGSPLGPH
jgi:plastocyanin